MFSTSRFNDIQNAAAYGNIPELINLLSSQCQLVDSVKEGSVETPLYLAVKNKQHLAAKILLVFNADKAAALKLAVERGEEELENAINQTEYDEKIAIAVWGAAKTALVKNAMAIQPPTACLEDFIKLALWEKNQEVLNLLTSIKHPRKKGSSVGYWAIAHFESALTQLELTIDERAMMLKQLKEYDVIVMFQRAFDKAEEAVIQRFHELIAEPTPNLDLTTKQKSIYQLLKSKPIREKFRSDFFSDENWVCLTEQAIEQKDDFMQFYLIATLRDKLILSEEMQLALVMTLFEKENWFMLLVLSERFSKEIIDLVPQLIKHQQHAVAQFLIVLKKLHLETLANNIQSDQLVRFDDQWSEQGRLHCVMRRSLNPRQYPTKVDSDYINSVKDTSLKVQVLQNCLKEQYPLGSLQLAMTFSGNPNSLTINTILPMCYFNKIYLSARRFGFSVLPHQINQPYQVAFPILTKDLMPNIFQYLNISDFKNIFGTLAQFVNEYILEYKSKHQLAPISDAELRLGYFKRKQLREEIIRCKEEVKNFIVWIKNVKQENLNLCQELDKLNKAIDQAARDFSFPSRNFYFLSGSLFVGSAINLGLWSYYRLKFINTLSKTYIPDTLTTCYGAYLHRSPADDKRICTTRDDFPSIAAICASVCDSLASVQIPWGFSIAGVVIIPIVILLYYMVRTCDGDWFDPYMRSDDVKTLVGNKSNLEKNITINNGKIATYSANKRVAAARIEENFSSLTDITRTEKASWNTRNSQDASYLKMRAVIRRKQISIISKRSTSELDESKVSGNVYSLAKTFEKNHSSRASTSSRLTSEHIIDMTSSEDTESCAAAPGAAVNKDYKKGVNTSSAKEPLLPHSISMQPW